MISSAPVVRNKHVRTNPPKQRAIPPRLRFALIGVILYGLTVKLSSSLMQMERHNARGAMEGASSCSYAAPGSAMRGAQLRHWNPGDSIRGNKETRNVP